MSEASYRVKDTNDKVAIDEAILRYLANHGYGCKTTHISSAVVGLSSAGRWSSKEGKLAAGRLRRRLDALWRTKKIAKRKSLGEMQWYTLDKDVLAERKRRDEEQKAEAEKIKAMYLKLFPLTQEFEDEDDRDHFLDRRLHYGHAVELTNEQFLSLCERAGVSA